MSIAEPIDPVESLQTAFPDAIQNVLTFRDETTVIVNPDDVPRLMRHLRDTPGLVYNFLSGISAVDYYPDPPTENRPERFGIAYHLLSMLYNRRLRVKAFVPEEEPVLTTITDIWMGANWLEREIMDMYGIEFEGHPDPRRLLMPEDWDGYPRRKDYPLGYETPQFSFNAEEIMKHKPFAKE